AAGHLDQTAGRRVETGESLGVRHMRERAVQPICPAVVAAHERLRATGPLDQGETAMPTCVAEHPRPLIAPPHSEQRHPEYDPLDMIARFRDRRGGNKDARHRTKQPELFGEPAWVQIVFDGLTPGPTLVGGPGVDMGEDAPNDLH